jgi:hypothetical protein
VPSKGASQRARQMLRKKYGDLPWICWWCHKPIHISPDTHHLNGIHDDDRPKNLVAVHHSCHNTIHRKDRQITEAGKQRLREVVQQTKPWTYPNPGHTGHKHSEETRAKMRANKKETHIGWSWIINPETGKREWVEPNASSQRRS